MQEIDKGQAFMEAFEALGRERGIAPEVLFDAIEAALIVTSVRRRMCGWRSIEGRSLIMCMP